MSGLPESPSKISSKLSSPQPTNTNIVPQHQDDHLNQESTNNYSHNCDDPKLSSITPPPVVVVEDGDHSLSENQQQLPTILVNNNSTTDNNNSINGTSPSFGSTSTTDSSSLLLEYNNNNNSLTTITSPQKQFTCSIIESDNTSDDTSSSNSCSPTSPSYCSSGGENTHNTQNNNNITIKRKKSVTFHPKIVTSSRLLSPAAHNSDYETDEAAMSSSSPTIDNDQSPSLMSGNNLISVFFKHPFWLVNAFQKSWRSKLHDLSDHDQYDGTEENSPHSLTLEKVMSRSIDIESPVWYFIPKKLITKYSSSSTTSPTIGTSNNNYNNNNEIEYNIEENALDPKYEIYYNYWAQLRDTLFLKLRKENRKKTEKNNSIQLWHGYHNAAILSFFIETQKESLCDLQKAIHFRIFDLLFESIAQNTASTSSTEKTTDTIVISEQELTLMKTVCFLYIETDHLFHASSVLYHIIRNYCFTADTYQKLVQKWNKNSSSVGSGSTTSNNNSNKEKTSSPEEVFPAINMDWKVVYLVLRLISKYIELFQNNSQRENFTSLSQYEEYCKVGKGFSQLSIEDLTHFRSAIIEIICKFKPNHDLYNLWKGKWSIPSSSSQLLSSSLEESKFPRLESEQEILENCFYILHLVISKERERMVSEKESSSPATNLSAKDSVVKDFIRKPGSSSLDQNNKSSSSSSLTLMGRLKNWLYNLRISLRRTNWRRLIMYIVGIVGVGIVTRMIYQFFAPNRSPFIMDERNEFSLSRNELHLPYLTSSVGGPTTTTATLSQQTYLPSPTLLPRTMTTTKSPVHPSPSLDGNFKSSSLSSNQLLASNNQSSGQATSATTRMGPMPPISTLGTGKQHPDNMNLAKDNIHTILKPSTFKEDFYKKIEAPNKQPTDIVVERDFNYITSLRNEMDHVFDVAEKMKKPAAATTSTVQQQQQDISNKKQPIVTFQVGEHPSGASMEDHPPRNNNLKTPNINYTETETSNYTPTSIGDDLPPFNNDNSNLVNTFIGTDPVLTNKLLTTTTTNTASNNNRLNNLNRAATNANRAATPRRQPTPRKTTATTPNTGGPKVFGKRKQNM